MTRWRAFWQGYHAWSALRPIPLDPPALLQLTALVEAVNESEVRALVLAHHPDAVGIEVRWAPAEDRLPPGPPAPGACDRCGTVYQGLGFAKLPLGPIELREGLYVLTRACVCRRPGERVFTVRWPLPLTLPWVRVQYGTHQTLGEVVQRSRQRVQVRLQDGAVLVLRGNGQSRNRRGLPQVHPEDLVRLPPKIAPDRAVPKE